MRTVNCTPSRVLEDSQKLETTLGTNTRNATNTGFTSYAPTQFTFPAGRAINNTIDPLYRRTAISEATGGATVAAWNFMGADRVAEMQLGTSLVCTWMNNARTRTGVQALLASPAWGDVSSDRLGYDGAARAITKRFLAGAIPESGGYSNTTSVLGFTTAFDRASNKFYERPLHAENRASLYEPFDSNGLPTGGYDSLDRLLQYQRGTLSSTGGDGGNGGGSIPTGEPITLPGTDTVRTFDLDPLGNWKNTAFTPVGGSAQTEVRQHNGLNEITRISNPPTTATPVVPTYDLNGNSLTDGLRKLQWDVLNRLANAKKADGADIGDYYLDALNRRIRKTVSNGGLPGDIPNGTIDCIYLGWRCVEDRNPFGGDGGTTDTPMMQYVWGIYLDELIQVLPLVAVNSFSANVPLYPMQDLLYRTTGLLDSSSGNVKEAYDMDAYGNTRIYRNAGTPPAAITFSATEPFDAQVNYPTCPFIFTGQRFDAETGLYYFKRRVYSPTWGRFLSLDPVANFLSETNPFCYVRNGPVVATDPTGLETLIETEYGIYDPDYGVMMLHPRVARTPENEEKYYWSDLITNRTIVLGLVSHRRDQARNRVLRQRNMEIVLQGKRTACESELKNADDAISQIARVRPAAKVLLSLGLFKPGAALIIAVDERLALLSKRLTMERADWSAKIKECRGVEAEAKQAYNELVARVKRLEVELEAAKQHVEAPPPPLTPEQRKMIPVP
jgi:RHS repeat-associated protein